METTSLVWQVFWVALLTDFATGLGAVPFAFTRRISDRWQGFAYSVAGGMMVAASVFALAEQGLRRGDAWEIVVGLLAGSAFYWVTAKAVEGKDWTIEDLSAQDSRQSVLMLVTMFIHSIPEGIAIGVGYATGELEFGLLLALAIALHNIPEGIAISLPLKAKGVSTWKCFWYAVLTSIPQPIAAVPAFLLVWFFQPLLPAGLGFAGGAMMFLVVTELIPESLARSQRHTTAW
ncbi:MAG: ZIP family metal transporter, partial [Rhodothermales bacterium]|nr:ZIP family metal transporter [Rhodothermales bacterium]